jgi:hypothetical protein
MNNKYLSLYGNRAGQFLTFQSPSPTQLSIFKVIQVTEEQHQEYISASKEKREELLEKYRSENPNISGEKKKIVFTEPVAPVVPIENANKPIVEVIEESIDVIEEKIEEVAEKLESIEAKMPVVKERKPRKK